MHAKVPLVKSIRRLALASASLLVWERSKGGRGRGAEVAASIHARRKEGIRRVPGTANWVRFREN